MTTASDPRLALNVACLQLNCGADMAANVDTVSRLIREARTKGAQLILTPENTGLMSAESMGAGSSPFDASRVPFEADHPALRTICEVVGEGSAWVLIGSLAVRVHGENRVANRSFLIAPPSEPAPAKETGSVETKAPIAASVGTVVARYDKIHLFDVPDLNASAGEAYRESRRVRPGTEAVLARTPWGGLGMTVCYDLRFPGLYRSLAQHGARLLSVPAAFTRVTGEAHWHTLLRARAIETGCFVLAPAQCGVHPGDRRTFGHSLIVDPWGRVLADGGEDVGVVQATLDLALVDECRKRVPSLSHDRPFEVSVQGTRSEDS